MKKFPFYHQLDAMDCGPSCLRMIARFYGKHYTLRTLRERCFITREGVSMLGISDAAESIGFRTVGWRTSVDQLVNQVQLPCILHWNQNHFVVCYAIRKKRNGKTAFYIADPASQRVVYQEEEFLRCWCGISASGRKSGILMTLTPGPSFKEQEEEEPEDTVHGLLFFARYLLPYKKEFFQLFLGMLLGSLLQLVFPFLTQAMVDVGIEGRNISFISVILLVQLTLFLTQLFVGFIRSWIMLYMNSKIDIALISDFLMKLMKLPLRYFDSKMTGDLLQRIGDHGRIKSFLMGNSFQILFSVVNFFIFSGILAYYHRNVFLIFMAGNICYVIWILSFMKYRRELDTKRFNQSANEQGKLIQLIQGMQEIKLNNCEQQKRWEWEHIQVKLFHINVKGLTIGQIQQIGSTFFSQSTNILISFIAAKAVVDGSMTIGMMMSLTYIIGQVSAPVQAFIGFAQSFQDAQISLERLNEIHRQKDEGNREGSVMILPESKSISLENVTFSYSGADRDYALDGVTLHIPQKKVTAIVGASGSGKTTLMKLLLGFYEPQKGKVKVGNVSLDRIHPKVWRAHTGSVLQDGFIFSDTITRNIAVGVDYPDQERLLHAVRVANIGDFIDSLPLGYSTKIGMEGNGISQGQRQRILIARSVYKNPDYLFFDEATNALDANNERKIMENLNEFYKGKTVVVAAHRLSTVRNADQIIVLDKGRVVEEGTHEELIRMRGNYYTLVKNQLELGNG